DRHPGFVEGILAHGGGSLPIRASDSECKLFPGMSKRIAYLALAVVLGGGTVIAIAADAKPDKKKSQAAFLRGKKADEAGRRDEAIAAYTEAIQADSTNGDALRSRAKDYQAAGELPKAQADLDKAVELAPASGDAYLARGMFFASTNQSEPAIHDLT